jgi:hypothetical protein
VSIINISEDKKIIKTNDLNKIKYDEYNIYKFNNDNDRIRRIKKQIKSDHMNDEERQSINNICEQYSEIFHLEGEKLTCTHAAMHEIKLNDNQRLIYKRP